MISPLLLNIALHGMEEAAGVSWRRHRNSRVLREGSPALVRYTDDFVVICHTEKDAHEAYLRLKEWFTPRGLAFNEEKTSVRHLTDGFDFLGCTIRTYTNGYTLVTPSKDAVRKAKGRIRDVVRSNRGKPADRLVPELNSFLRGWTAYYRPWSSKRAFKEVDRIVFGQLWQWASRQHRRKGRQWIAARYWDKRIPGATTAGSSVRVRRTSSPPR
ncbi:group II intron maturase-specific domain-containing protein [Streptomyces sp. NPDC057963]|uniref:group II intron maturase-specific domain-containing protein n=1 Tax=Streptomyces sp. NPDC057963 TaxID=3346290 RepID=UPI0036ED2DB3